MCGGVQSVARLDSHVGCHWLLVMLGHWFGIFLHALLSHFDSCAMMRLKRQLSQFEQTMLRLRIEEARNVWSCTIDAGASLVDQSSFGHQAWQIAAPQMAQHSVCTPETVGKVIKSCIAVRRCARIDHLILTYFDSLGRKKVVAIGIIWRNLAIARLGIQSSIHKD